MKQIIPFKKELPFKTKVSEITSISLEREITVEEEGIVTGVFHITGDYKMNEGSINRENFSFNLPFDITLDPRYDVKTVFADIEDFYYDVLNEDTLKVNIDLFVEANYLPESEGKEEHKLFDDTREEKETTTITETDEEDRKIPEELEIFPEETPKEIEELNNTFKEDIIEPTPVHIENNLFEKMNIPSPREDTISVDMPAIAADLFSNLDDTETYTTYYVYIVKEDDTIDKILTKYGVTKEDIEAYNDIADIKPGTKVIIPKTSE